MIRISLTEEDFATLVSGGVVKREQSKPSGWGAGGTQETVEIALQDIGWGRMMDLVHEAIGQRAKKVVGATQ